MYEKADNENKNNKMTYITLYRHLKTLTLIDGGTVKKITKTWIK